MNLNHKHIAYFIGIGGIGMSALARWFKLNGMQVSGYDRTITPLTKSLEEEGIHVHYEDSVKKIPEDVINDKEGSLIVYTPAIPEDHKEYNFLHGEGYEIRKRSEVLGMITSDLFTVAVAGTHGKTTTSSMIAHILHESGKDMVAFLGGISANYNSNLIYSGKLTPNTIAVVEADEFDRSFLRLNPDLAIVTSADADHLDIYGNPIVMKQSFKDFIAKIKDEGTLFINEKIASEFRGRDDLNIKKYALTSGDARSENLRLMGDTFILDYLNGSNELNEVKLEVPGYHNAENLIAAIAVCLKLGIAPDKIKNSVSTYKGVKRRFEFVIKSESLIFIDDYAHHPVEIEAFLTSLKHIYEGRKLTVVFQPHLYSRTRDFADEFAKSLRLADELLLLDIYPARELPIEGVTSDIIFNKVNIKKKVRCSKNSLLDKLYHKEIEVLATVGAGDIDQLVDPIKNMLMEKYHVEE